MKKSLKLYSTRCVFLAPSWTKTYSTVSAGQIIRVTIISFCAHLYVFINKGYLHLTDNLTCQINWLFKGLSIVFTWIYKHLLTALLTNFVDQTKSQGQILVWSVLEQQLKLNGVTVTFLRTWPHEDGENIFFVHLISSHLSSSPRHI